MPADFGSPVRRALLCIAHHSLNDPTTATRPFVLPGARSPIPQHQVLGRAEQGMTRPFKNSDRRCLENSNGCAISYVQRLSEQACEIHGVRTRAVACVKPVKDEQGMSVASV
ncbi:MAG: hypothetical protein K1X78_10320 [Verrucomicrobiaceae bacterium]|nr:hypothetical protein [Verrucomicrobiaceae bacterium]